MVKPPKVASTHTAPIAPAPAVNWPPKNACRLYRRCADFHRRGADDDAAIAQHRGIAAGVVDHRNAGAKADRSGADREGIDLDALAHLAVNDDRAAGRHRAAAGRRHVRRQAEDADAGRRAHRAAAVPPVVVSTSTVSAARTPMSPSAVVALLLAMIADVPTTSGAAPICVE